MKNKIFKTRRLLSIIAIHFFCQVFSQSNIITKMDSIINLSNQEKVSWNQFNQSKNELMNIINENISSLNYLSVILNHLDDQNYYHNPNIYVRSISFEVLDNLAAKEALQNNTELKVRIARKFTEGILFENEINIRNQIIHTLNYKVIDSVILNDELISHRLKKYLSLKYENGKNYKNDNILISNIRKYKADLFKDTIERYCVSRSPEYISERYKNNQWEVNFTLAFFGDEKSKNWLIDYLRKEKDLRKKYSQIQYIMEIMGDSKFMMLFYELYMGKEGEKREYPIGKGATYRATYTDQWLNPLAFLTNPLSDNENMRYKKIMLLPTYTNEQKEISSKEFIKLMREYLTRTKNTWMFNPKEE